MTTKINRLAILGTGPSGLLAAHAAVMRGVEKVWLITQSTSRSSLYGCQYLHREIPGLSVRSTEVEYQLRGTPENYRRKVYGPDSDARVSPEDYQGLHRAWDIREAYDILWRMYASGGHPGVRIIKKYVVAEDVPRILPKFDMVISTIPAHFLCKDGSHTFESRDIWAMGDAPSLGIRVPLWTVQEEGKICCNAAKEDEWWEDSWYRASTVFGMSTVEWPGHRRPLPDAVRVRKPIKTDCDCFGEKLVRMGRYGAWKKGVLAHNTFYDTYDMLADNTSGGRKCL